MSNRSGTSYSAPTDANHNRVLLAASSADGITPLPLEINPATGRLLVDSSGGGGGSSGNIGIDPVGQNGVAYDSITYTATSGTVDTYQYYTGGTGGTVTATVTVTFTDSGHGTLVSVVRT
jgi:hypothetical protein